MFRHPTAIVETDAVGEGTRILAFAHIAAGARIGRDCNVCDHALVESDVLIGDRVTVRSGVQLSSGITIEDDVIIGPNATLANDQFPHTNQFGSNGGRPRTLVKAGASIGANATILPGVAIGERSMVGAGSVVTHDVPPGSVVFGNPANIVSYVDGLSAAAPIIAPSVPAKKSPGVIDTCVRGVRLYSLPLVEDLRGWLTFAEIHRHLPFDIKRYFLVFDVPGKHIRGEHAHHRLEQFLVCVHGSCSVIADDGYNREEFILDQPSLGLYLPPMTWGVQHKYTEDAVLLVLTSDFYDPADYIRNYDIFKRLARASS